MGYGEFVEWVALDSIEPIGGLRADTHTAMLMALMANVHRDAKKNPSPYEVSDFMPDWWEEKKSPAALMAKFRAITEAMQARDGRSNG